MAGRSLFALVLIGLGASLGAAVATVAFGALAPEPAWLSFVFGGQRLAYWPPDDGLEWQAFDAGRWKEARGRASPDRFLMLQDLFASRNLIGRDRAEIVEWLGSPIVSWEGTWDYRVHGMSTPGIAFGGSYLALRLEHGRVREVSIYQRMSDP